MSDILTIDGVQYNVNVVSLMESSEFLDSAETHRTILGDLFRRLIGIYFNYELELGEIQDPENAIALWNAIHTFVPFHTVTLPHNEGLQTFKAYVTGCSRPLLKRINGVNYWGGYKIKFIAKAPQIS